jgi:hypothetical protein
MSADASTAINEVLARYCAALDRDDVDAVVALFTDDARYTVFGRTIDREELGRMLRDAPKGIHLGGLPVIELDGPRARVTQNLIFVDARSHAMRLVLYDDELLDTAAGWRFASRRVRFVGPDGLLDRPPA